MITEKLDLAVRAKGLYEKLVTWRRTIHANPELSFKEVETSRFVIENLKEIGVDSIQTGVGKTGVVGTISSGNGPTVALRADMDALPIKEAPSHSFRSNNDGIMHACGHDAHTAMLLGAASLLVEDKQNNLLNGTVKLIFQPAEEDTDEEGKTGAPRMMEDGVLDGVDAAVALHVCPWQSPGTIQVNDHYSMANIDVFEGKVYGTGGHGGYPHLGTDPIWMLSSVLPVLYGIVNRRLSSLETAVMSICKVNAGTASNVIPEEASITGTLRSYTPEAREQLVSEVESAFRMVEALGGRYEFVLERGEPALNNDPVINREIVEAASQLYRDIKIEHGPFGLGGEDFGFITKEIPGAMFFLGCALPDGISRDLHTPIFDIDETCLPIGTAILTETAHRLLKQD
ncbi:M20 family metallopeptidase [Pseudalkalibacillus caeni]|uniref:M20 metallopeptidase family protein n=1 Tax=Exobacillus caeni TaxID=2574798 RepID=UPI0026D5D5C6